MHFYFYFMGRVSVGGKNIQFTVSVSVTACVIALDSCEVYLRKWFTFIDSGNLCFIQVGYKLYN